MNAEKFSKIGVFMNKMMILDGGMGRELHRRGAPFRQPEWSALALMEAPESVRAVHADFIRAGAQVITTNSYAVVPFHIGAERFAAEGETLIERAGRLAREAVEQSGKAVLVAGCLPPLFGSYRYDLFDESTAPALAEPFIRGLQNHADIWLAETVSSTAEAVFWRSRLPQDGKPFWLSFTLDDTDGCPALPRLRSGESVAEAAACAAALGAAAMLFNCSQPEVMAAAVAEARRVFGELGNACRIGVYANAFEPVAAEMNAANEGLDEIRRDTTPLRYAEWARAWQAAGASMIGGCCGIGPEHIAALAAWAAEQAVP